MLSLESQRVFRNLLFFCFVLLYKNHLMTGSLGTVNFGFSRISMFSSTSCRESLRFSGNKAHCFPRDQSLSVKRCTIPQRKVTYCNSTYL